MTVKVHKEVQIFKRICTRDGFGDHVEEVHFPQAVCLTGVKVGAVPSHLGIDKSASVDIFAEDLTTLGAARFACLAEGCELPETGTKAVRLEAIITQHVVLRGRYQTLPIALYGWAHACQTSTKAKQPEGLHFEVLPTATPAQREARHSQLVLRQELSTATQAALNVALLHFAEVKTSEKAMRNKLLPPTTLPALLAIADCIIEGEEEAPGVKAESSSPTFDGEAAAEMAAGWCRTFAAVPRFGSTAEYGLSGLAAAVILSATPKYATKFLAAGGVLALTRVLTSEQQIPRSVRYVLAAIEALMTSCPAAACEALLGWWNPTSEENQAKIRVAQEQEGYNSDADGEPIEGEGYDEDAEHYPEFHPNGRGQIPQYGDATGDVEGEDCPGTPAILYSEDEDQVKSENKDSVSQKDKKATGSKKDKKDKKEKRERKDKDKSRDGRKTRHRSKDEGTVEAGSTDAADPSVSVLVSADPAREVDTGAGTAVQDAIAAAAAKAAELAAEVSAASQAKNSEASKTDQRKSTQHHRRREEDTDLNDRNRKRRRRSSRSRSRSRAPSEGDARDAGGAGDREDRKRATREGRSRNEKDVREDSRHRHNHREAPSKRAEDAEAGRETERLRERDRDKGEPRRREADSSRDRVRERDSARERDRHRRERGESREGPSERESHRDGRSHFDDFRGRGRRDGHRDDRRDRPATAFSRDDARTSRREGGRSQSRERAAEDSARMPPPETPPHRGVRGAPSRHPNPKAESPALGKSPTPSRRSDDSAAKAMEARDARIFEEEAEAERQRAMQEAASFGGCYPALVTTLLHLLPQKVAAMGARILSRLKVYEDTARFQLVAEEAVRGHAEGTETPLRHIHLACTQAGTALARLAQALLSCPAEAQPARPSIVTAFSPGGIQLGPSFDLDPWVEEALSARCCLPIVAALLHVPKLQALHQKQVATPMPGQTPEHIQAQLVQPLHNGLSHFLSALMSCPAGFAILSRRWPVAMAIMEALHPGSSQTLFLSQTPSAPKSSGYEISQSLKAHLAAAQSLQRLAVQTVKVEGLAKSKDESMASIVQNLLEVTVSDAGKRAVISALIFIPGAFQAILSLSKDPIFKVADSELEGEAKPLALWQPSCIYAVRLLSLCLGECNPRVLAAWTSLAAEIKAAVGTVMNMPEVQQPGADKAKRDLRIIKGRADMAILLKEKGLGDMMSTMETLLPPIVKPEGQRKGLKQVDRKACLALIHSQEKAAQVETGLHILHALLCGPLGAHACVHISHSFGLEILERALRCGTEAFAASKADAAWVSIAGDAIDIAEMAANRERAASLLASSLGTLALLLPEVRLHGSELNSATLMRSILQAYSLLATSPESFSAVAGHTSPRSRTPVLLARQAAASALRCWVDADNWTPDLVTAIFTGGHPLPADGPLVMVLSPAEMVYAASLLGDLFPSEWPPQGNAARLGMSHPPPAQMAYRRTIAHRFESSGAAFKRLVEFTAASTCRILRATLVRLCAKASGLGGGMGTFLAVPLMADLEACMAADLSLQDARRMLEIMVPLMYRPAMKAAFLDQGIVNTIAKLLTSLMSDNTSEEPEINSMCTMALEIVTVLFNPDICLNPLQPVTQRVIDDCPSVKEAASLISVLLSTLTSMAGNAHISKRIIAGLANHPSGRASLRLGCLKWQARAMGMHDSQGFKSAVQWVVTRLWQLGQEEGKEAGMREICMDVANQLEEVANSGEDFDEDPPLRIPAPQRFVAAVQASVTAAEALGMPNDDSSRGELAECCSPEALIHDAVTRMFWKNVKARATDQSGRIVTSTMTLPTDQIELPASNLKEGLTKPKRARDTSLETGAGLVSGGSEPKEGKAKEVALKAASTAPQSDLPPVLAGPGRPKGRTFGRAGGSTGRPASMHVDDYESKAAASQPASGPPKGPPVPPPRPPPGAPKPPPPKGTPPSGSAGASKLPAKASPQKPAIQPKYPSKPIRPFGAPKPAAESPSAAAAGSKPVASNPASSLAVKPSAPSGKTSKETLGSQSHLSKPSPIASSPSESSVANLVRSPAAIAELLKDPAKLQQLLEQNPTLMSVLQAKMQGS